MNGTSDTHNVTVAYSARIKDDVMYIDHTIDIIKMTCECGQWLHLIPQTQRVIPMVLKLWYSGGTTLCSTLEWCHATNPLPHVHEEC